MSRINDVTFDNVFAQNASTAIPSQPITGVAYRDDTQTGSDMESGQSYDSIYNSARYNQLFYQITSLLADMARNGLLAFQSGQHYNAGARVLHNGVVYIARREILANEQPYPLPSNESQVWLLYVDPDESLGGVGASNEKVPTQKAVKTYADTQDATTLTSAKTYADEQDATTLTSAKTYADEQAKTYADGKFLPISGTATNSTKWANYSIGDLPNTNFGTSGSGEGGQIVLVKGSSGASINIDNYYGQLRFFGNGTGTSTKVYTLNIDNGTLNIAASKLGTSTVGSSTKPIFLNNGTATAGSEINAKFVNVTEIGKYLDFHADNATAKYDYDCRIHAGTQGTATGATPLYIIASELYASGKVVERVDSSGTNWIRFVSGLQICWGSNGVSNHGVLITFPKPFTSSPIMSMIRHQSANSATASLDMMVSRGGDGSAGVNFRIIGADVPAAQWIAIGRWK